jgi:hypothetical protein
MCIWLVYVTRHLAPIFLRMYSLQPQKILSVLSAHAACLGGTDHLQAFKYTVLKTQSKMQIY